MATVAQLDVRIGADIKSFQQGMAKLENQLKQVGSNLRNTGRQLSTAVTLPLLGIGAAAVKAASDAEEMQSKFNTVFKTVGGDVTRQLDAFARASGRSRYELRGMAGQLGDIFKPLGYTEKQAGNLSVQVAKLAVDLGSFNNMPMDEALARLRGTLIGSHENALAFGVVINEASLKQELMRMGADKLTGAQLNQAKVQARLNLLMAGTTDAQGDAIRTSDSFANQFQRLRNATYDLGVAIGELLLPYARQLVGRLQGMVDYVQNLNPETKKLGIILAGVAAAAGPLLFTLGGMASGFSAIMRAVTLTMGLFNPYVAGLAAIAAIFVVLTRGSDSVQAAFKTFGDQITTSFKPAWDTLKTAVSATYQQFVGWWDTNGETVKSTLATTFGGLITAIGGALGSIAGLFTAAWDAAEVVTKAFVGEGGTLAGLMASGTVKAVNQLGASLALIASTVQTTVDQASGAIQTVTFGATGKYAKAMEALKSIPKSNIDAVLAFFDTLDTDITSKIDPNTGKDAADATMGEGEGKKSYGDRVREILTEALGGFVSFKTDIKDPLINDEDSVSNTAGDAVDAIGEIKNTIDGLTILKPSFGNLKSPITEVKDEAKLAHDYMQQMLKSLSPEELAQIKTDPEKVEEIAALFAMMAPKELPDPNKYNDFIKNFTPTDEQEEKITRFGERMRLLSIDLDNASHFAFKMSDNISDIEQAWRPLFGTDSPQWMKDLAKYASDATLIVTGLQAMVELLKPSTWTEALGVLKDLGENLWNIVTAIGEIILKIAEWVLAQAGIGGGGPDFTGGAPGISIPGSGGGATTTAGGSGAGGGVVAGVLTGLSTAAIGAIIGANINAIIQARGIEEPWTRMGITREEWIQQQIESGAYAQYLGNLMGPGSDLSWLSGASGGIGGLFGGTPSWLSGLQGYMGTGGSANTSGIMGSGSMGSTQTININLDGQQIATATVPYMAGELELYGTNY